MSVGEPVRRPSAEPAIVGRDTERVLLSQFLDADRPSAVAAILTGPAGIGKTALWEWTLERAASLGYLVLVSRAGIAEAQLPWVGLTDLLRTAAMPVLAGLPPLQRAALQVVMLQSDVGEPVDERSVGTALWSVLSAQAQSGPVLIALDDLPYMDAASAGALRFALRRMGPASRVRLIATARGDGSRWAPLDGLPGDQVLSVGVGPVTVGALFELLAARLAVRLARPVLLRVHGTPAVTLCTRSSWPGLWTGWRSFPGREFRYPCPPASTGWWPNESGACRRTFSRSPRPRRRRGGSPTPGLSPTPWSVRYSPGSWSSMSRRCSVDRGSSGRPIRW
jgi:hypothetical protein